MLIKQRIVFKMIIFLKFPKSDFIKPCFFAKEPLIERKVPETIFIDHDHI